MSGLVYLCSERSLLPTVPAGQAKAAIDGVATEDDAISIEDFFLADTPTFARATAFPCPRPCHCPSIRFARPTLSGLIDAFDRTRRSPSISPTTRRRSDTAHACQKIIKMATTENPVREILYTNCEVKTVFLAKQHLRFNRPRQRYLHLHRIRSGRPSQ